ncbi:hypothetical protein MLD38_012306 [Melastoma candidum]|uniref:Uncharacterized protein n=1 Tax=Melastoma candidum TaxID=119954 RepID=A0ACB9R5W2_9MYRT|nr:hypothetical protein MLD38_012306 [Melastoma candidum]
MSLDEIGETDMEMEAAEALAGLARGGNSPRGVKVVSEDRVKVESMSPVDSETTRPDIVQTMNSSSTGKIKMEVDDVAFSLQEYATSLTNVCEMEEKTEQVSVFLDHQNHMCSTSCLPSCGGRSRHNLSEAEKEAKRIRRVLANRESARRTIHRRQALCEDLTSRAAELTEENRMLKKTKELALKENESLGTMNKNLKVQIASTVLKMAPRHTCASSSANGNRQAGTSNVATATPTLTMPSLCRRDLPHEQEKLLNMAGPGPPGHMVPCPWFITDRSSSLGFQDQVDDLNITIKAEPPNFIVGDLNEPPIESPPLCCTSSSQSDVMPKFAKYLELGSEASPDGWVDFGLDLHSTGSESVTVGSSNQENIKQSMLLGKQLGDVIATKEARRRRREIKRLKGMNGRRC